VNAALRDDFHARAAALAGVPCCALECVQVCYHPVVLHQCWHCKVLLLALVAASSAAHCNRLKSLKHGDQHVSAKWFERFSMLSRPANAQLVFGVKSPGKKP
jgi:hypothetical protein